MCQLARRLPFCRGRGDGVVDGLGKVLAEELWRQVDLVQVWGNFLEVEFLVKGNLQLWLQVVCAKVQLDAGVLVSSNSLILLDDGICVAWVEGLIEDALRAVFVCCAVEVDVEALVGVCDPYSR